MGESKENQPCNPKQILQSISILRQLNKKFCEESEKKPLFGEETQKHMYLQVTMKKIPTQKLKKCIKIALPHSIISNSTEVCLIAGDLDKRDKKAEIDPDILHYKEMLKKQGITQINEVMTLRQLRKEYKPYEARRHLSAAYDIFLCEKKIAGVLHNILGKAFFQSRKVPIPLDICSKNLKQLVENALSTTTFRITCKGNSCASEIATFSMSDEEALENISTAIKTLVEKMPGGVDNIAGLYVKTEKSKAIPIYMSFRSPNDINVRREFVKEVVVAEELSTLPNARVKVFKGGKVVVHKRKAEENVQENVKNEIIGAIESLGKTPKSKARKSAANSSCEIESIEVNESQIKTPNPKVRKITQNCDVKNGSINLEEQVINKSMNEAQIKTHTNKERESVVVQENVKNEIIGANESFGKTPIRKTRKSAANSSNEIESMEVNESQIKTPKPKSRKSTINCDVKNRSINLDEQVINKSMNQSQIKTPKNKVRESVVVQENVKNEIIGANESFGKTPKRKTRKSAANLSNEIESMEVDECQIKTPKPKSRKSTINCDVKNGGINLDVQVINKSMNESQIKTTKNKVRESVVVQENVKNEIIGANESFGKTPKRKTRKSAANLSNEIESMEVNESQIKTPKPKSRKSCKL